MKKYILSFIILSLLFVFIGTQYNEESFKYEFTGIKFAIGSNQSEEVNVIIEGFYMNSILHPDYTKVLLTVNDILYPDSNKYNDIVPFEKRNNNVVTRTSFEPTLYSEIANYHRENYDVMYLEIPTFSEPNLNDFNNTFSRLYISKNKENFIITINKGNSWYEEVGYEIIVSATTQEEAIEKIKSIFKWDTTDW